MLPPQAAVTQAAADVALLLLQPGVAAKTSPEAARTAKTARSDFIGGIPDRCYPFRSSRASLTMRFRASTWTTRGRFRAASSGVSHP